MKKITIMASAILSLNAFVSNAAVLTVSNSPVSAGQYTVVDSAIAHSSVGDTVYVNGSAIDYTYAHITKRIVLIGAGYAVTGTAYNLNTMISNITIDSAAFSGNPVNGTHIIGIYSTSGINPSVITTNVIVERCATTYINTGGGQGWIIQNNIITSQINLYGSPSSTISSCIIRNNFFTGSSNVIWANSVQNAPGLLIDHNIMEGTIGQITYATMTNNIFFFAHIDNSSANNYNVYNNNITVYSSADTLPFGTNSGAGNLNNLLPGNVFGSGVVSPQTYPALLAYNWQVNVSSPGHHGATDGTDIGMYGGPHAMPNLTGASTLPQMTLLNISNSSIPLNGTLNYEFKARKQN
jgi:hypothetical protein